MSTFAEKYEYRLIKMNYTIELYSPASFSRLESAWKDLQKGRDMTIFQSYSWYSMLNICYVPQDTPYFTSLYAVIKRGEETVLIAPLWIVKRTFKWVNKKGVYFLGREGWSDYLNFIYKDFDGDAVVFLLKKITEKYKIHHYYFSELKKSSQTYNFFLSRMNLIKNSQLTCVALSLPSTKEDYNMLLSKNARQNIRTAHNRLKKDGKKVHFVFDDKHVDRDFCREMREHRFVEKFRHFSRLRLMKHRLMYRLTFHFKPYLPFMCYDAGHFLTTYIDNNLCSFFYYIIDDIHQQIFVIAAGVNLEYSRYSPGIISLHAFIEEMIEKTKIDIIDFTRGDEPYKYAVGGKSHYIANAFFKF